VTGSASRVTIRSRSIPNHPGDSSVEARTAVSPGRSALAPDALSWNTRASLGEGIELQRWSLVGRRDPRVAELRHPANALCPKTRPTTMCLESHHQRRSADSVAPDRQSAHWRSRSLRTSLSGELLNCLLSIKFHLLNVAGQGAARLEHVSAHAAGGLLAIAARHGIQDFPVLRM
jgi:hypothetical protein